MALVLVMAPRDHVAAVSAAAKKLRELFPAPSRGALVEFHVDPANAGPELAGHRGEALVLGPFAVDLEQVASLDRVIREDLAERHGLDPDAGRSFGNVAQDRVAAGLRG